MPSTREIFPVGSIYISTTTTNPSTIFGGTWEQIKDKFLLCSGSTYANGSTGGNTSHGHSTNSYALTVNDMPSHSHVLTRQQWYSSDVVASAYDYSIFSWKNGEGKGGSTSYSWQSPENRNVISTGSGNSHTHGNATSKEVLPPYIAVTVWKRIA